MATNASKDAWRSWGNMPPCTMPNKAFGLFKRANSFWLRTAQRRLISIDLAASASVVM